MVTRQIVPGKYKTWWCQVTKISQIHEITKKIQILGNKYNLNIIQYPWKDKWRRIETDRQREKIYLLRKNLREYGIMPSSSSGSKQSAKRVSTCSSSRFSPEIRCGMEMCYNIPLRALWWQLTQRKEGMLQFSQEHGAVFLFVVQFQTFNEIFVATLFLFLLDLRVDGKEFIEFNHFQFALLGTAHLFNQSQGGVQVEGTKGITQVVGIDTIGTTHNFEYEFDI